MNELSAEQLGETIGLAVKAAIGPFKKQIDALETRVTELERARIRQLERQAGLTGDPDPKAPRKESK